MPGGSSRKDEAARRRARQATGTLTYAAVCCRMLPYADAVARVKQEALRQVPAACLRAYASHVCMLIYINIGTDIYSTYFLKGLGFRVSAR